MFSEGDAPYNIYAKMLFVMRQGYPLWHPEIERERGLEIKVGDVGYLHEGAFIRFFNATLPEDHEDHKMFGVPHGHKPFKVFQFLRREQAHVIESHLCSRSVKSFGLEGGATMPMTPVGAGMKFQCSDEQGAFVFMNVPADKKSILPPFSLTPYLRSNIDRWDEYFRTQRGIEIALDQVIFISGVAKTEDWGLGTFVSHAKGSEVTFTAQVPFFHGTFSVKRQVEDVGDIQYRAKPFPDDASSIFSLRPSLEGEGGAAEALGAGPSSPGRASATSLAAPVKRDQTLFFNYYKMKARWFMKRAVKAAAGPDERDPDRSGDGEDLAAGLQTDGECDVVEEPPINQTYDPVDYLLDYILEYPLEDGTEVQAAIASDLHIYAFFDGEIPLDIKEQLEKLRPPVKFVDDTREVACLAIAEWAEELPEGDETESKAAGTQKDYFDTSEDPQPGADRPQGGDAGEAKDERDDKDSRGLPGLQGEASIIFQDYTGGVARIAFSPDGRYLASSSEDTTAILRDGTSGVVIPKLTNHHDAIRSLAFSPDNTCMYTGVNDGIRKPSTVQLAI